MIRYRARWIIPIEGAPIRDGWILCDRGRVVALGGRRSNETPRDRSSRPSTGGSGMRDVDLGEVALLPGLVNAHTHLELSYLHDQVPPSSAFVAWIRAVMAARRQRPDPAAPEITDAVHSAIDQAVACGTAVVADISNTLVTFAPLVASPLAAVVFYELIRFNAPDPEALVDAARRELDALPSTERVRASLAAHAPYSVAPLVLRAIRRAIDRDPFAPCSVHLAESVEEVEFIRTGTGAWRVLLEEIGVWDAAWTAPGVTPVQYLDETGFLDGRVLAVHGVQMTAADLERLVARGTTLVVCPRSNVHTGAGVPPLEEFYKSGVRIAIGTDSLASAPDLNVFAEMATLHALAPSIAPSALLESATRQGALALGFDAYGSIAPGKRARLVSVAVPAGVDDVEEYLVSGIGAAQVGWVEESGVDSR